MKKTIFTCATILILLSCNNDEYNINDNTVVESSFNNKQKITDTTTILSTNIDIDNMVINNNLIYTNSLNENIFVWNIYGAKIAEIPGSNSTYSIAVDNNYIYAIEISTNYIKVWNKNNYTLNRILKINKEIYLKEGSKVDDKYFYATYTTGNSYGIATINKHNGDIVKYSKSKTYNEYSMDDNFLYEIYNNRTSITVFDKDTINIVNKINIKDYFHDKNLSLYINFIKIINNDIYIGVNNKLIVLDKNTKKMIYFIKQYYAIQNIFSDNASIYISINSNIVNVFDKKSKTLVKNAFKYNLNPNSDIKYLFHNKQLYFFIKNKVKKINISNAFSTNSCLSQFLIKEIVIDNNGYGRYFQILSKDNKYVAYINSLGNLNLVNMHSGKHILNNIGFHQPMSFNDDSNYLVYSYINEIHIVSMYDFSIKKIKYNNSDKVKLYTFSQNNKDIIVYKKDINHSMIDIINIDTMSLTQSIKIKNKKYNDAVFSPDKKHILFRNSNKVILLNIYTSKITVIQDNDDSPYYKSIYFSPNGQQIYVIYMNWRYNSVAKVYNLQGKPIRELKSSLYDITIEDVSSDGKYLLGLDILNNHIIVFDMDNYEIIEIIHAHENKIAAAYFGIDSKTIFSFGTDNKLKIWNTSILSSKCINKTKSNLNESNNNGKIPQI